MDDMANITHDEEGHPLIGAFDPIPEGPVYPIYLPEKAGGALEGTKPYENVGRDALHALTERLQMILNSKKMTLPTDPQVRKGVPMATGLLDYFPLALAEVARLSKVSNEQHNPGQPLHWAREKSSDHADCIVRHLIDRGAIDTDNMRHSAKVAWRALALLQLELEAEKK